MYLALLFFLYFPFLAGKMILLPNFIENKFRYFYTKLNTLYLCLSYSGMKYDTSPFYVERLARKKLDFICFSLLTSLAFIEVYVLVFATCIICGKSREFIQVCVVWCRIDLQRMRKCYRVT